MNSISLVGRLTAAPETVEINAKDGTTSVTKFTLAVNRPRMKDKADFIRCEAWGRRGEIIAEYVGKGQQLAITGSLIQDQWKDKETDKYRETFKVLVDNVHLLGSGSGGNGGGSSSSSSSRSSSGSGEEYEGLDIDTLLGAEA